jgi:hypothetical protein
MKKINFNVPILLGGGAFLLMEGAHDLLDVFIQRSFPMPGITRALFALLEIALGIFFLYTLWSCWKTDGLIKSSKAQLLKEAELRLMKKVELRIMEEDNSHQDQQKRGFFSRLFGGG